MLDGFGVWLRRSVSMVEREWVFALQCPGEVPSLGGEMISGGCCSR